MEMPTQARFMPMLITGRKKNFIANLKDGEQVVTSHEGKAQLLWDLYSELLGAR
jgi:hypothetical protein